MITACKSIWFERIFSLYNGNLLARRFESLRAAGLECLRTRPRDAPLVLYANHSSWWDGLIAFQVGRACALDHYVMMEERHLREYSLFRRLGAFSVVRENPRDAARSIEYAGRLLRHTDRALWMFPQGRTLPNDARPLRLFTGVAHIIKRVGAAYAAPVAMRYEFLDDFRPEALARVGPFERVTINKNFDVRQATHVFTERLTATLEEVRKDVLSLNFANYEEIVAPRRRKRR